MNVEELGEYIKKEQVTKGVGLMIAPNWLKI